MNTVGESDSKIVECDQKLEGTDVDYYKKAAEYWEGEITKCSYKNHF